MWIWPFRERKDKKKSSCKILCYWFQDLCVSRTFDWLFMSVDTLDQERGGNEIMYFKGNQTIYDTWEERQKDDISNVGWHVVGKRAWLIASCTTPLEKNINCLRTDYPARHLCECRKEIQISSIPIFGEYASGKKKWIYSNFIPGLWIVEGFENKTWIFEIVSKDLGSVICRGLSHFGLSFVHC